LTFIYTFLCPILSSTQNVESNHAGHLFLFYLTSGIRACWSDVTSCAKVSSRSNGNRQRRPLQSSSSSHSSRSCSSGICLSRLRYIYYPQSCLTNIGTQNYTCNATTNTFSASGTASAKLLDVTQFFTGTSAPATLPAIESLIVAGSHYFVPNPLNAAGAASPRFENPAAFFIGVKNASVASSQPSYSVATVLLQNIQAGKTGGNLADWVVRTDVLGGVTPQALESCQSGDQIAIPYKAHYLFFKNSN